MKNPEHSAEGIALVNKKLKLVKEKQKPPEKSDIAVTAISYFLAWADHVKKEVKRCKERIPYFFEKNRIGGSAPALFGFTVQRFTTKLTYHTNFDLVRSPGTAPDASKLKTCRPHLETLG